MAAVLREREGTAAGCWCAQAAFESVTRSVSARAVTCQAMA
jgi:hypothetical protein